jgi:hypothetical protein
MADDHLDYHRIAENLVAGQGYVQGEGFAYGRQPGWPVLLAIAYFLFGSYSQIGVWVTGACGMLTVVLTYRLTRQVISKPSHRLGLCAACMVALDPFLIVSDQTLLTESLYTLLLMVSVLILVRKYPSPLYGAVIGLLTLVRSNGIGLLIGAVGRYRSREWIGLLIALGIVLSGWIVRNGVVVGSFSPFAPQTGQLLLGSYNQYTLNIPDAYGMWLYPKELADGAPYAALPYLEREAAWAAVGWAFIRDHVADIPVMMSRRVARLLLQPAYIPRNGLSESLFFVVQPLFLGFLWIGCLSSTLFILRARSKWGRSLRDFLGLVLMLMLPALLTAALLYGEARFRLVYHPLLVVIIVGGLSTIRVRR